MTLAYSKLCAVLAALPATTKQAAERAGVRHDVAAKWLRELRAHGIVKITARVRDGAIVWNREDAAPFERGGQRSVQIALFARLWRALQRSSTVIELGEQCGCCARHASYMVNVLRRAGLARVSGWVLVGATQTPRFDRLPAADAPKPAPMTRAEACAKHRARVRGCEGAQIGMTA